MIEVIIKKKTYNSFKEACEDLFFEPLPTPHFDFTLMKGTEYNSHAEYATNIIKKPFGLIDLDHWYWEHNGEYGLSASEEQAYKNILVASQYDFSFKEI